MKRSLTVGLWLVAAYGVTVWAASAAQAQSFGGFSPDGKRYLVGGEKICWTLADSQKERRCAAADTRAVAAGQFRRLPERNYRALVAGTRIEISRAGVAGPPVVRWDVGTVPGRIVAVYGTESGSAVAVEYEVHDMGRLRVDVVGFFVTTAPPPPTKAQPRSAPTVDPPPVRSSQAMEAAAAARARGAKLIRKRRWKEAEAAYREALRHHSGDHEARYRLAVVFALSNQQAPMLKALRALAVAQEDDAAMWLFEARTAKAFKRFRKLPVFRTVVGLDPSQGATAATAYRRLVEHGGVWSQRRIPCEQAGVRLALAKRPRTFTLQISVRCRDSGDDFTIDLDGTWLSEGPARLLLVFPNEGEDPDERVQCEIVPCEGEDCVSCRIQDDQFLLRSTRR